jgi:hypothetical protein
MKIHRFLYVILFVVLGCSKSFNEIQQNQMSNNNLNEKSGVIKTLDLNLLAATIYGDVIDKGTGKPIPGATVKRKSNNFGVFTNTQGKFSMVVSAPVSDILIVSSVGYTTQQIQFTVTSGEVLVLPTIKME